MLEKVCIHVSFRYHPPVGVDSVDKFRSLRFCGHGWPPLQMRCLVVLDGTLSAGGSQSPVGCTGGVCSVKIKTKLKNIFEN